MRSDSTSEICTRAWRQPPSGKSSPIAPGFCAQLAPDAARSILSPASRREMTRKHWRNPDAGLEGYYGLGIMSGTTAGWDWFGHTGGLQGFISRTATIPECELTISIMTNAT